MRKEVKDRISLVLGLISFLFIVWLLISFVDVNLHNGINNSVKSAWNFFVLIKQIF